MVFGNCGCGRPDVTLTSGTSGVVRCDSADVNADVWREGR